MRNGKLLKGGEPDIHSVSINVINDWQRVRDDAVSNWVSTEKRLLLYADDTHVILQGKLPYFVAPPMEEDDDEADQDDEKLGLQGLEEEANEESEVHTFYSVVLRQPNELQAEMVGVYTAHLYNFDSTTFISFGICQPFLLN